MGGRMETIMTTTPRPRAPRPQIILEVVRSSWVTPHLVRLTLGGPGFADFQPKDATDSYVKISFAKPELGLEPPYDLAALRETLAPADLPVTRTYTVRRVDQAAGTIDIDFVVHGDEGIAGPWAAAAQPGDRVVLAGPGGAYRPDPTADWHLFAGDESAIPAIAAALEALPADATGLAFLEIGGRDDLVDLDHPAGVQLIWVGRAARDESTAALLATAISGHPWPDGRVQAFVHGESALLKSVRPYVLDDRGVSRHDVSVSAYWRRGTTEEGFRRWKSEQKDAVMRPGAS